MYLLPVHKNMADLELTCELSAHEEMSWHVSWNPTGSLLASCGSDKTIKIWGEEGRHHT